MNHHGYIVPTYHCSSASCDPIHPTHTCEVWSSLIRLRSWRAPAQLVQKRVSYSLLDLLGRKLIVFCFLCAVKGHGKSGDTSPHKPHEETSLVHFL